MATKFTLGGEPTAGPLAVGNSRKTMIGSLEASLRRLKTDRIDLYWAHLPDGVTSTEEIIRGFDDLVRAGKVLYIGLSDFPAWRVSRAVTLAELRGWAPVIGVQTEYSLVERTPDRELLPMAQAHGLGIVGWSPLGGGLLTGKYRRGEEGRATTFGHVIHTENNPIKVAAVDAVIAVVEESGVTATQVALAWMGSKSVLPIIGARTQAQIKDSLGAVNLTLSDAQIARLDAASAVPLGFPHNVLASSENRARLAGGMPDRVEVPVIPIA